MNSPSPLLRVENLKTHFHTRDGIVRAVDGAPYTRFLADDSGRTVLEVYSNPKAPVPDYASQHWLVFHFALVSANADADRSRRRVRGASQRIAAG